MASNSLSEQMRGRLPSRVTIREVGPREGFQRGPVIPAAPRIAAINKLVEAGVRRIQLASLVNPKLVPQMADAETIVRGVNHPTDALFDLLCLNMRGIGRAFALREETGNVDQVDFPCATTDAVLNANGIRHTVKDYFANVLPAWVKTAHAAGLKAVTGVSAAFGCSIEGPISEERALEIAKRIRDTGVDEMYISDSTGEAVPTQVVSLFEKLLVAIPDFTFLVHFHNNRGLGIANALALLQLGEVVTERLIFDTAICEHGGCPFLEAAGNLSTEDFLCMAKGLGIEIGVNFDKVLDAARLARDQYESGFPFMSHTLSYGAPVWWPKTPAAAGD